MIGSIIIGFIKIVLVIIALVGMVMLLLGINHFSGMTGDSWDDSATDQLKDEIRDDSRVLGEKNLFHKFLAREINNRSRN